MFANLSSMTSVINTIIANSVADANLEQSVEVNGRMAVVIYNHLIRPKNEDLRTPMPMRCIVIRHVDSPLNSDSHKVRIELVTGEEEHPSDWTECCYISINKPKSIGDAVCTIERWLREYTLK